MEGCTDRDAFKARVPVVTYEDLRPEIERIANGDRSNIISSHPISDSGTSAGERKLMPTIEDELDRRQMLYSLLMPVMNLFVPGLDKGKGLYFLFIKSETKTPGGLPARPVLTSYYKSDHFKYRPFDAYQVYTSPTPAILCTDSFQSMYSQMLCGLLVRTEVLRVGAVFASGLLRAIRFLQLHWKELARDIETGTLSAKVVEPSIRAAVAEVLEPNPDLAAFVAAECAKDNWEGIITRMWPNTKYLDVIVTGAMAQYIPTLKFYSGGLPMACTMYASSECYFGLNLRPMCDPSEVTGFHNAAPQFRFVRRKNVLLSIDSDKTDEAELQAAVERAARLLAPYGASIVEYTSEADATTIPGHYVVYWELMLKDCREGLWPEAAVFERCCLEMEEALNSVYRQGRNGDAIGPLEIRVVRGGTFEEVMDYAISRGASINQYKAPRCVSFGPIIELLNSRVLSKHFSPACPKYGPPKK
ncbi:unnamed protein product [Triticum turgidum subsp. durum]|uniref:GH3 C-terminal domain-containing protein n=1 Tax=Triticum turgidum subsp. durum TaxID=4567 RepID=A0A9R1QMV1_TRITD|nr:unnamed protein product [Triticum turgidum subsp. durum]